MLLIDIGQWRYRSGSTLSTWKRPMFVIILAAMILFPAIEDAVGSGDPAYHEMTDDEITVVLINEIYPDPSIDVNGDGNITQEDEFVELLNTGSSSIYLENWTIMDNYDSFTIPGITIDPLSKIVLSRSLTGLKLGRSDEVVLKNNSGESIDRFAFESASKGDSFQRIPDGAPRWSSLDTATPGEDNPSPPDFVINEVMVDPEGSNTNRQWMEIVNRGDRWSIRNFRLTNHDSFELLLPDMMIEQGERFLIGTGNEEILSKIPPNATLITITTGQTMYISGDDLEILDMDGYSMDHVAWGSSSHVDRPTGIGSEGKWLGRYYDPSNKTMSIDGEDNPVVISGRSLSRIPDRRDTDSPSDLSPGPAICGSTPCWNNSMDPDIIISIKDLETHIEEDGEKHVFFNITRCGNLHGEFTLETMPDDGNWSADIGIDGSDHQFGERTTISGEVLIGSPPDLRISKETDIELSFRWNDLPFLAFRETITAKIPYFDCSLDDVIIGLDGYPSRKFPEGSIIGISGSVVCEGMLDGGNINCTATLTDPVTGPFLSKTIVLKDLKSTSTRKIGFEMDTLGIEGNHTLKISLDPENLVREPDEKNNNIIQEICIIPTSIDEEIDRLMITEVLWNTSIEERAVAIINANEDVVDLSGIRISDGTGWFAFPDEAAIVPEETVLIAFGPFSKDRFPEISTVYRCDGQGPRDLRMEEGEKEPDILESGKILLTTRYRDVLDSVILRRELLPDSIPSTQRDLFPESTWGTVLSRRQDTGGYPVKTGSGMDWRVPEVDGYVHSMLIDPGIDGPGEFISVSGPTIRGDLSGLGLVRGRAIAVIPNGTIYSGSPVIISDDPEAFKVTQLVEPDLAFSEDDGYAIPSCKVPGWGTLSLPNSGGTLVIVDNGNRPLKEMVWDDESDIERGGIISFNENGMDMNPILSGTGSLPFFTADDGHGAINISRDPHDIPECFLNRDRDRITAILPSLTDIWLVSLLSDIRSSGTYMDIYLTHPPWERDGIFQADISSDEEMGYLRSLGESGARLFSVEGDIGRYSTATLLSSNSIWSIESVSFEGTDAESFERKCMGIKGNNGSIEIMSRYIHSMIDRYDWFDPTPLLESVEPVLPEMKMNLTGRDQGNWLEIENINFRWSIDPSSEVSQPDHLRIEHHSGPLDISTIASMMEEGKRLDLVISPHLITVEGIDALEMIEEFGKEGGIGKHSPTFKYLEKDLMPRIKVLIDYCKMNNIDLRIGLLDDTDRNSVGPNIWSWGGGQAYQISADIDSRIPLWLTIPTTSVGDAIIGNEWADVTEFPRYLIPYEREVKVIPEGPDLMIDRIYFDTYLKEDPDEAIRIINTGNATVDISGFILTDDEGISRSSDGLIIIPDGYSIAPHDHFWISRDGGLFEFQFGFSPDISIYNSSGEGRAYLSNGDLRLANTNDTVSLRDGLGRIIDVVPYGEANWEDLWLHQLHGAWHGEPVPPPGWGKILFRWKGWGDEHPIDTDSANDWKSPRPMFPGQSSLEETEPVEVDHMECGIDPDSGSSLIGDAIEGSTERIFLNVYELTSQWIVSSLIGARSRGVHVKVILEGGPVGGISYTEKILADRMTRNGIEIRWMNNIIQEDIRDRYRYDHAKYLVVDGKDSIVSTDNLKDSSFPEPLTEVGGGTRGWTVRFHSEDVASSLESLFDLDWNGPDMIPNIPDDDLVDDLKPIFKEPSGTEYGYRFEGKVITSGCNVRMLVCPDHISTPENPLYSALSQSRKSIDLELMDIGTYFSSINDDLPPGYNDRWNTGKDHTPFENPYLNVLFEKASAGVNVRLLLDGSDFDGDGKAENMDTARIIEDEIIKRGIEDRFKVLIHPSDSGSSRDGISLIHNKGVLIDDEITWISSFNFGATSALENREVGFLMASDDVAEYFSDCFEHDWDMTIFTDLKLDMRYVMFEDNGNGTVDCRMSIYIEWDGDDELTLSITTGGVNDHPTSFLSFDDDLEDTVTGDLHSIECSEGDELHLVASSSGRNITILSLTVDILTDDNGVMRQSGFMDSKMAPVSIIIALVLLIGLTRTFVIILGKRDKGGGKCTSEE